MLDQGQREYTNVRSLDRVLVLEEIPGMKAKSSTGLVDNRLWKGGNRVRAVLDGQSNLWSFKYDDGRPPEALSHQKFTKFSMALDYAKKYFAGRGLKVVRVED